MHFGIIADEYLEAKFESTIWNLSPDFELSFKFHIWLLQTEQDTIPPHHYRGKINTTEY